MKIRTELLNIPGVKTGGVNPLPPLRKRGYSGHGTEEGFPEHLKHGLGFPRRVMPYLMQDRYTRKREMLSLKSYVLENEYLKVTVLPEYGGRVHSIYDKCEKRELLFTNTVIQPGNLAIRNAWLSGGIEWNFGIIGHSVVTCDNIFAAILPDGLGNDFLRIYEFERGKSAFWQVDLHLPEGSPRLISHVRLMNPFNKPTTTYWWTNIAVTDDFKTRILASNKYAISFLGHNCCYDRLPVIKQMPGIDASFPKNATGAFDYFIQKEGGPECTWEAAAYGDGLVFYERSTAPLYYKKLFCWGAHSAAYHWQEFLSDGEGTGYYAEIQAGIAPSQVHDKEFPANSEYEWTQCFGGVRLDYDKLADADYDKSVAYLDKEINAILSEEDITALDEKLRVLARVPVKEENLSHRGTGFAALEIKRMKLDGDATPPESLLFPDSDIGQAEAPWLTLLKNGYIPELNPGEFPASYMISEKWLPRIKRATEEHDNKTARLHLGTFYYEHFDTSDCITEVYDEKVDAEMVECARREWQKSLELAPSIIVYRNLAYLESVLKNTDLAEEYYDKALALDGAFDDYALASEYLSYLAAVGKYEKLWSIFESLPEACTSDRISITAAKAAVKLGKLDYLEDFFAKEHHDIREGEVSLTDIWFEFSARKLAEERGIAPLTEEKLAELIDEAEELLPPRKDIDFRMTVSKKSKYRVGD